LFSLPAAEVERTLSEIAYMSVAAIDDNAKARNEDAWRLWRRAVQHWHGAFTCRAAASGAERLVALKDD
jgi:hypothetical protein